MSKKIFETPTCEGLVDDKSTKNKALKGKVGCKKPAKVTRTKRVRVETETGETYFETRIFHLCGTCARSWDGIPAARSPKPLLEKELFGVVLTDMRDPLKRQRRFDVTVKEVPLFDLPPVDVPQADRVRLMPGQTRVYEVWLAGSGGAVPMSEQYIHDNYEALVPLLEQVKDDGTWVEMSK